MVFLAGYQGNGSQYSLLDFHPPYANENNKGIEVGGEGAGLSFCEAAGLLPGERDIIGCMEYGVLEDPLDGLGMSGQEEVTKFSTGVGFQPRSESLSPSPASKKACGIAKKKLKKKPKNKNVQPAAKTKKKAVESFKKAAQATSSREKTARVCWTKEEKIKFIEVHNSTAKVKNFYTRIRSVMIAAGFPERKAKEYGDKWNRDLNPDLRKLKKDDWEEKDIEDLKAHIEQYGRTKWSIFREKTKIPDQTARRMSLRDLYGMKDIQQRVTTRSSIDAGGYQGRQKSEKKDVQQRVTTAPSIDAGGYRGWQKSEKQEFYRLCELYPSKWTYISELLKKAGYERTPKQLENKYHNDRRKKSKSDACTEGKKGKTEARFWTSEEEDKFLEIYSSVAKDVSVPSKVAEAMKAAGFPTRTVTEYKSKWSKKLNPDLRKLKTKEWKESDIEDLKAHIEQYGRTKWSIFRKKTKIPDHKAKRMSLKDLHGMKYVQKVVS